MVKINQKAEAPGTYNGPKPPEYLKKLLTSIGGLNEYGVENFRLVWAPARRTASGGVWLDWLPNYSFKDRNTSKGAKPWRREAGVRMIPRYGPVQGWALERWVPAKAYGSRARWYAPAIIGGTMVLVSGRGELPVYLPSQGEYPSRGDYEYTGYAFDTDQLAEATVIPCMQALIMDRELLPTNPQRRVALRSSVAAEAVKMADKADEQWALDRIEEAQPAFGGRPFVGAGTKRPHSSAKILKKLGISSHHIS